METGGGRVLGCCLGSFLFEWGFFGFVFWGLFVWVFFNKKKSTSNYSRKSGEAREEL